MREKHVFANQINLRVQDYESEGEAIIFLHFSGANLMMWQRVVPYFQDRYRLILVDLRGHGNSDRPETGYHMDEMARDIVGLMQSLDLERAYVVGSSLGAEVGLSLAAHYPDQVISLVCDGALSSEYGPYGIWEGSETAFKEYVARQLEKMRATPESVFPSVDALVEKSRAALEEIGWWNEYVEAVERYGACKLGEGKYTKSFRKSAMLNYVEGYFHYRFEDYYQKVQCPVLMLPGEDVLENEREKVAMQGLCELTAQGKIIYIPGWVHPYGWLLDPEAVCQTIRKFFSGQIR